MSVSYFVLYQGKSTDGPSFIKHYKNRHVKILEKFPRIRKISMHLPTQWKDTAQVNEGSFALIVQMEFDDIDTLNFSLRSAARREARSDMIENFPEFEGIVLHQATSLLRT